MSETPQEQTSQIPDTIQACIASYDTMWAKVSGLVIENEDYIISFVNNLFNNYTFNQTYMYNAPIKGSDNNIWCSSISSTLLEQIQSNADKHDDCYILNYCFDCLNDLGKLNYPQCSVKEINEGKSPQNILSSVYDSTIRNIVSINKSVTENTFSINFGNKKIISENVATTVGEYEDLARFGNNGPYTDHINLGADSKISSKVEYVKISKSYEKIFDPEKQYHYFDTNDINITNIFNDYDKENPAIVNIKDDGSIVLNNTNIANYTLNALLQSFYPKENSTGRNEDFKNFQKRIKNFIRIAQLLKTLWQSRFERCNGDSEFTKIEKNKEQLSKKDDKIEYNDIIDIRNIGINGRSHTKNNISSRSYKMNEDFLFTNPQFYNNANAEGKWSNADYISKLIVNEFQPNESIPLKDIINNTFIGGLAEGVAGLITTTLSPIRYKIVQKELNRIISGDIQSTNLFDISSTKRSLFPSNPMDIVMNMFNGGGDWLNDYELPYWENNWLKSNYSGNFKQNSYREDTALGTLGELTMGIDFPLHPRFKADFKNNRRVATTEFYLVNHDTDWLKRNYDFINCIFAGSAWVHLNHCSVKSPNVYHVECPGRFVMMWAALDMSCEFGGKLRKAAIKMENGNKAILENMLWPDYWKIKLTFTDLTPNNYNAYAYYYNYYDKEKFTTQSSKEITGGISAIKDFINQIGENVKSIATNAFSSLSDEGIVSNKFISESTTNKNNEYAFSNFNEDKMREEFNKHLSALGR